MPQARIDVTHDGAVARVFLARPELRNAFDGETVRELTTAIVAVSASELVRVIVLGGQGPVFSSGADIEWMRAVAGYSREQNVDDARELAGLFFAIDRSPKPVVARVQGAALGGGAGLVAAADIAIAAADARFGFSEVRLGLVPAVISPWVVRRIGLSAARELFLTGERFSAEEAARIGLVRHVVPPEQLDQAVEARVRELLYAAPGAIAAAKALLRTVEGRSPEDVRDATTQLNAERRASAEGQEGLRAFLDKRKAGWAP
jgi:methylglutaconyl-CoA hydratase